MTFSPEPFEAKLIDKIRTVATADDPAHDFLHFQRVVHTARGLCAEEGASLAVVLPAAWLHDLVIVPKNDPRRARASTLSAEAAVAFLREIEYPAEFHDDIAHAVAAHSFSANITPRTLEAKVVQDADRLDGLGAIGIARVFATGGLMKRLCYATEDPFCKTRPPNDGTYTVDHFFAKLFRVSESLQTASGRIEGARRAAVMRRYLADLAAEI